MDLFTDLRDREAPKGILPSQDIQEFIRRGHISSPLANIDDGQIQPASIDLRLGQTAYRVRASFLPGQSSMMINKTKDLLVAEIDLGGSSPALFEPECVFIVPLMERLRLPSDVRGIANPKSTTGRLDILTRLITERGDEFDRVKKGYSGELFLEVVSRTFPIYVRAGMKLNQLRFVRGNRAPIGDGTLGELAKGDPLVYEGEQNLQLAYIDRGLGITVDLQGSGSGVVAYEARKHAPPIELDTLNHYDIDDFWRVVPRPKNGRTHPRAQGVLSLDIKAKSPGSA